MSNINEAYLVSVSHLEFLEHNLDVVFEAVLYFVQSGLLLFVKLSEQT